MAHHVRRQIRDAVAGVLDHASVGVPVTTVPKAPISDEKLRRLIVSTPQEQVQVGSMGNDRYLRRDLTVQIGILVADNDDAQDALDEIAARVEDRLNSVEAIAILRALLKDFWLAGVSPAFNAEGIRVLGGLNLLWTAVYHTRATDARTAV